VDGLVSQAHSPYLVRGQLDRQQLWQEAEVEAEVETEGRARQWCSPRPRRLVFQQFTQATLRTMQLFVVLFEDRDHQLGAAEEV
jgi:hypothetical protein